MMSGPTTVQNISYKDANMRQIQQLTEQHEGIYPPVNSLQTKY